MHTGSDIMAVEGIVVTGECSSCTLALGRLEFGAKAVRNPRAYSNGGRQHVMLTHRHCLVRLYSKALLCLSSDS